MARRFFSGNTVEQALLSAARAFQVNPDEIAYTTRDKKHGFIKVRRKVVIEVDPDAPVKSKEPERQESSAPKSSPGRQSSSERPEESSFQGRSSLVLEDEGAAAGGSGDRDGAVGSTLDSGEDASRGASDGETVRHSRAEEGAAQSRAKGGDRGKAEESHRPEPRREGRRSQSSESSQGSRSSQRSKPPQGGRSSQGDRSSQRGNKQGGRGPKPHRSREGRGRAPEPPPQTARKLVSPEEAADLALDELTHFLCVDVSWKIEEVEGGFEIEIEGADQEWLLDDDGSLLLAIEHLLPRMIRSLSGQSRSCSVDCDNFHSSHEDHLRQMAANAAEETIRSGRPQILEPMNPADRRVVHLHLVNDPTVSTQSKGDGLFKRVKILPARPE